MLAEAQLAAIADRLLAAERDRAPIAPLTQAYPDLTPADAYAIQLRNVASRQAPVVGHKVGLTSAAMQQMMGVAEPDYGHLMADMRLAEDVPVPAGRYCYPRVEIEVAFILGADLPGAECREADVLAATEALAPAIELIDSRILDWRIGLPDTIADNASSAGFVLGQARVDPAGIDLRGIVATLWRGSPAGGAPGGAGVGLAGGAASGAPGGAAGGAAGGTVVARGRSDAVLGNPATAVAWLARTVAQFGVRLRAGHIVLPGAVDRAVDARPGDEFRAEFAGLGTVGLCFTSGTGPEPARAAP
jgi:2-keto-4-pentenoate hydratase